MAAFDKFVCALVLLLLYYYFYTILLFNINLVTGFSKALSLLVMYAFLHLTIKLTTNG